MTTKEMIAVMEHFDRGGKIEVLIKDRWIHTSEPLWDWYKSKYRIKSEPKVIPWTANDWKSFHKEYFSQRKGFFCCAKYQVEYWTDTYVCISCPQCASGKSTIPYSILLSDYIISGTDKPCGTIVNE